MGEISSAVFIGLLAALILLGGLALTRLGLLRLESPLGVIRDGFPPGRLAPAWRLPDLSGHPSGTPHGRHWQILIFCDHALVEFPGLVAGVKRVTSASDGVDGLLITKGVVEATTIATSTMGLNWPIVEVDDAFYQKYNVRVMPFVFVIDPSGVVQGSAVINYEDSFLNMWHLAHVSSARHGGDRSPAGVRGS